MTAEWCTIVVVEFLEPLLQHVSGLVRIQKMSIRISELKSSVPFFGSQFMNGLVECKVIVSLYCASCQIKDSLKSVSACHFCCCSHLLACMPSSNDVKPSLKTVLDGVPLKRKKLLGVFLKKLKRSHIKEKNWLLMVSCVHTLNLVQCLMHLEQSIPFRWQ